MKILLMCFSATGNTAAIARVIAERLGESGCDVRISDITPESCRPEALDLSTYHAVVLGAPVHSARAPRLVREWLRTLDGQGKKCSMFFTYGGFGVLPAHHSTRQILREQNFVVVASAEFLSAHTFNMGGWKAAEERPDASDFEVARHYADAIYRRFTGEDDGILEELEHTEHTEEFLDAIEAFRFKVLTKLPSRDGQECSLCMACEESCPAGAMDAESGEAEGGRCIACLACVAICPERCLNINDMRAIWPMKLKKSNASVESINAKKSRLYL